MKFPRSNRRGFTLVEIMIAIAVFTMVIGAIYAAWMSLMRSTRVAEDVASQAQRQRITLRTIGDALMAVQSFQASPQYYSFVVEGAEQSSVLSFTARVPEVFPRNGKFINPNTDRDFNLRRLTFSVEADGNRGNNLVLRQNPVLMDLDEDEQQYPLILARNVRKFVVECWGTNQNNQVGWDTEWLNTNSIPTLVRVNLVLGGNTEAGEAAPDYAVARVLCLPSHTMPTVVQSGPPNNPASGSNQPNRGNQPNSGNQITIPNLPNPARTPPPRR